MKTTFNGLIVLFSILMMSCASKVEQENRITVTIEPQRYFAEQLADTLFTIESMTPKGSNPETYDPAPAQLTDLARSRAYFCIGHIGFEQAWIKKLKKNNPQVEFFDNSNGIGYIGTEYAHGDHVHKGIDPHTWTSPKQAEIIVKNMYEALLQLDPGNKTVYEANYNKLLEEIKVTDVVVRALLGNTGQKEFIIYHPALTYFANDYGLVQHSIEMDGKEPSPAQIKELVEMARDRGIKTIFVQEEFDKKNAKLIAKETGCRLVVINPLSYNWQREVLRVAVALSR